MFMNLFVPGINVYNSITMICVVYVSLLSDCALLVGKKQTMYVAFLILVSLCSTQAHNKHP